jgi:hypothetical protein
MQYRQLIALDYCHFQNVLCKEFDIAVCISKILTFKY